MRLNLSTNGGALRRPYVEVASLRFCVNVATERRQHTQVEFVWITQRFRTIAVFPINWERLDAGVFTSMLSRPQVDLTFERFRFLAPCQRLRAIVCVLSAHLRRVLKSTCVCLRFREQCLRSDFRTRRKCADKTKTIARKRWHGARKRKRSNVRSTCGRL